MLQVVILFSDGELLYARLAALDFDLPVLEAEVLNVDSNSERAILPLSAIRQIIVGANEPAPPPGELSTWDRAAFHFVDGQVMRAWMAPHSRLGAHGGVWTVVEPDAEEMRTLAIPYTALKGVFRLRQWDGRSPRERAGEQSGGSAHLDNVVRVLAERDARASRGRWRRAAPLPTPRRPAAGEGPAPLSPPEPAGR